MDSRGKALVAIFLGLLAVAFTGTDTPGIGFAKECIEGIDNDADGFIDWADTECFDYPYADGNGESYTQIGSDYQGEYYEYSMFDYEFTYGNNAGNLGYWCDPVQASGDPGTKMAYYQSLDSYSNGKDRAAYDYQYWFNANCP